MEPAFHRLPLRTGTRLRLNLESTEGIHAKATKRTEGYFTEDNEGNEGVADTLSCAGFQILPSFPSVEYPLCRLQVKTVRDYRRDQSVSRALSELYGTEDNIFHSRRIMSEKLTLLRQNFCRSVEVDGPPDFFPLERESAQGKAVLEKQPTRVQQLQRFNPHGLLQTYRDEQTGAELPVFAIFNLEGSHRLNAEVTMTSVSTGAEPGELTSFLPLERAQAFVRKINTARMQGERIALWASALAGIVGLIAFFLSHNPGVTPAALPFLVIGVWSLGAFLAYLVAESLLNRIYPWKKLVLTAEFDGILPQSTREIALAAKHRFSNLYLIVDQQKRWQSALLRDPVPRALDPLLIGELRKGSRRRFFLLDQFDLTAAEQYLADEFATK